jgi:hypothetical protein
MGETGNAYTVLVRISERNKRLEGIFINDSVILQDFLGSQNQSYVTTEGQSANMSRNKAPIRGLRPDLYYCQTVVGLLMWGALSDERTGLSFTKVKVSSNKSVVNMYNLHFTYY